jgi:hypothetical protein
MVPVMPANNRLCLQLESFGLIGMKLPEKYKELQCFERRPFIGKLVGEGPLLETSKFSLYFQVVASLSSQGDPPLLVCGTFGTAIAPHTYFFQKARFFSKCNWKS